MNNNHSEKSLIILCIVLLLIIELRDSLTKHWILPEEIIVFCILLLGSALYIRKSI